MEYYQNIAGNFQQTIELVAMSVDALAQPIEAGSLKLADALLADHKILVCGNGADAALGQLFVSNLLNRFEHDRPALPAISLGSDAASLTAIATSGGVVDLFARQIRAIGQPGDVLLCISSGHSHGNIAQAILEARDREISAVVLSNSNDLTLEQLLTDDDVKLPVEATRQPRVVELHTMVIQCLCELIEQHLFGGYEGE